MYREKGRINVFSTILLAPDHLANQSFLFLLFSLCKSAAAGETSGWNHLFKLIIWSGGAKNRIEEKAKNMQYISIHTANVKK